MATKETEITLSNDARVNFAKLFIKDLSNNYSSYYHIMGRKLQHNGINVDTNLYSLDDEINDRKNTVLMKKVSAENCSLVIPKVLWNKGDVYEEYDNIKDGTFLGATITEVGSGYLLPPQVYIGSEGAKEYSTTRSYNYGELIYIKNENGTFYFLVLSFNIDDKPAGNLTNYNPILSKYGCGSSINDGNVIFQPVSVDDAGGSGTTAISEIRNSSLINIKITKAGNGYTSKPSIIIVPPYGSVDNVKAAASSIIKLPTEYDNYVLTSNNTVYKCISNNGYSKSTVEPTYTGTEIFSTSDDYLWKYMFTIKDSDIMKFYNTDYMPCPQSQVDTSSNGELQEIKIINSGYGYSYGNLVITNSNGYVKKNPYYVTLDTEVYEALQPTLFSIKVTEPHSNYLLWSSGTNITKINSIIKYESNFYKVLNVGNLGINPPSHRYGSANNGSCELEFYGTEIESQKVVTNNNVTNIVFSKNIRQVKIDVTGSGYTSAPIVKLRNKIIFIITNISKEGLITCKAPAFLSTTTVEIKDNSSINAGIYKIENVDGQWHLRDNTGKPITLEAAISDVEIEMIMTDYQPSFKSYITDGYLTYIEVLDEGRGIEPEMELVIGEEWELQKEISVGQQIIYDSYLYTATTSGVITKELELKGTDYYANDDNDNPLIFKLVGAGCKASITVKSGSFYRVVPSVTLYDNSNNEMNNIYYNFIISAIRSSAVLLPIFKNGELVDFSVIDPGVGYTYCTLEIIGDGSGALVESSNLANGTSMTNNETFAVKGEISNIKIIEGGSGFTNPTIIVSGDGSGFSAKVDSIGPNGEINSIKILTRGKNYHWIELSIADDTGSGAILRGVLSPLYGHGYDPSIELYAHSVMLYTNINVSSYQNFILDDAYRQVGLISNPLSIDGKKLSDSLYSPLWIVGFTDTSQLSIGDVLTSGDQTLEVIAIYKNQILAKNNLMSLSKTSTFSINNITLTPNTIIPPTVDIFSGNIIFIDNSRQFQKFDDENVVIRTVIEF